MSNQTYVARRQTATFGTYPPVTTTFARNRNTVRLSKRSLGAISQIVIVCLITVIFGLIYVAEGTKATSYDYEISGVETEISEMAAQRDDLAVEKARLTSVATAKTSTVAAAMTDAVVTGYVSE